MFVYNTENYHQVTEVTKGERVALVVWVESFAHLEEKRALFRDFVTFKHRLKTLVNIENTDIKLVEHLI